MNDHLRADSKSGSIPTKANKKATFRAWYITKFVLEQMSLLMTTVPRVNFYITHSFQSH